MRILFLLTQDLDSPLGIGRIWPLAHKLSLRGNQVRIAALHSNWQSLPERKMLIEGVTVEYVAQMHVLKVGNKKVYFSPLKLIFVALRATWALSRAALSGDEEIIHIGKPQPMNSIAGLIASRLHRSKLCLDCDDFEASSNHFQNKLQQKVVAFFETNMPRMVRLVTTNTMFMKAKLLSWNCPADKIYYLANGIETDRFTPRGSTEIEVLRDSLGLAGKSVILFIGTLSLTNHPVDLLLKAMTKVVIFHPNVVLLIVGGGEDYILLNEKAKELNINQITRFVGRVNPKDVSLYYELADVSVDPVNDDDTARGRLPLKLFESWVNGVPFITADVGDRCLFLSNPPAGIVVQHAGDPEALADGILQVLENIELSNEIIRNGIEQVKSYTWDILAAQLEQEYLKLL